MPKDQKNTKQEKKQQEKIIEDRTFGLKNKNKSKTVQKYIKGVAHTVKNAGTSQQRLLEDEFERKREQKKKEEEDQLMAALFKTVETVKKHAAEGEEEEETDPKKIVCAFFKQGLCQKGKKCKYSHDLSIEKQGHQIDIYTDQRTQLYGSEAVNEEETCEEWNTEKLQQVIQAQQHKYKNQKPTEIVCRFFLDAVEKGKYGWKWMCPNGMTCHYRHCLPPGYVLRKDMPSDKPKQEINLEEKIDQQISSLESKNGTPLTFELYTEWKKRRRERLEKEKEEKRQDEAKKVQSRGKNFLMSGRAMFLENPDQFQDDEEAADNYEREEYQEDEDDDSDNDNQQKLYQQAEQNGGGEEDGEDNEDQEETKEVDLPQKPRAKQQNSQPEDNGEEQTNLLKPAPPAQKTPMTENGDAEDGEAKQGAAEDGAAEGGEKKKKKKKKNKKQNEDNVKIDDQLFLQEQNL